MDCPGFSIRSAELQPSSASLQLSHYPGRLLGSESWLATLPSWVQGSATYGLGCAVPYTCSVTPMSPQGLDRQGPKATLQPGSSEETRRLWTWRKPWAEESLQDRRHASQRLLPPGEVQTPVIIGHCSCSFRHQRGPRKYRAET